MPPSNPIDLHKVIQALLEEKSRLDTIISSLEELEGSSIRAGVPIPGRRGRRLMSAEERRTVSERMKKYWAQRRKSTR